MFDQVEGVNVCVDLDKIDDAVLGLLWLTLHDERRALEGLRLGQARQQASGSTSLSLAVIISVVMASARSAPRSEPANSGEAAGDHSGA